MHARSIALVAPMLLWSGCLTAQRSVGPGAAVDAAIAHSYRPGIDVLDYNLSLELPARGNEIAGDAVLSVRRTARVDTLVLDLVGLVVDSVRVDGVRASFSRPAGEIHVALPQGVTGSSASTSHTGGLLRMDSSSAPTAPGVGRDSATTGRIGLD